MVLPCGHTLCLDCVTKLGSVTQQFKCPFDKQIISNIKNEAKPNYTLLKLISKEETNIKKRKSIII